MNKPTIPNFICYKCGYKYYGSGDICPKCYSNNKFPIIPFICLLSTILMFLSINFMPLFAPLFIIFLITFPFGVKYSIDQNKRTKAEFKIPDFPSEIINREPIEFPEIIKTIYIDGLNSDKDVKNIIFSLKSNYFTINKEGMEEIESIPYEKLANLEILNDKKIEMSYGKSFMMALVGSIINVGVGITAGVIGGIQNKDVYALLLEVKNENTPTGKLLVGGTQQVIHNLYYQIYGRIPKEENQSNKSD